MNGVTRQRVLAFTLIEALLAAVILAMAISAITMPFTAGFQNEQAAAQRTLAVSLAQEMMEEILSKPFYDPDGASQAGPEAGETSRDEFDNIDDYNGYTESAGAITDLGGQVVTDAAAANLSRHVTAAYVYVSGQDHGSPPTFVRVTVEVRHRNQPMVTLSRLVFANR